MDVKPVMDLMRFVLDSADFSLLTRQDVFLGVVIVFLAILRKRGIVHAVGILVPCIIGMTIFWGKMAALDGRIYHIEYFAAFVGVWVMVVLYLVYLYTLRSTVD